MSSASSALIQTLANNGVEVIFSLSGNQIMPLYDACIDANIRIIHTRHEGAAVYMAEAYAQLSGKLGVALVTAGPGLLNAVSALYSAARSETPILLISGDAGLGMDGRGGFQELDQCTITAPITKYSARPENAAAILSDLDHCIAAALGGTPGPTHLALAFDLLSQTTGLGAAEKVNLPSANAMRQSDLDTVITAIEAAKHPLIITGPQANRTRQPAANAALEAALGLPIICLESARGLSDSFYGDLTTTLKSADLIIHLGKLADYSTGLHARGRITKGTPIISILTDDQTAPMPAHDDHPITLIRTGNIPASMIQLAKAITDQEITVCDADWPAAVTASITRRLEWQAGDQGRHPAALTTQLQFAINQAASPILIADGGEFCQWVQAGCIAPRRMINGPSGAIGGGIAYAIGASIACPDAEIFLVMGDGTAGFYLGEIHTAVRTNANITAIIGNDYRWNAEVQIQIDTYGPDRVYGCDLDEKADYAAAAIGLGAQGQNVGPDDDLDAALRSASATQGPTVLNVLIDGQAAPKFIPIKL
ncbi:thiamine pyrophosphate-binding protein [Alphaproteobacteria bacterium]|nr:thiamine pyrophosphate-binding protein [Alphaproteobacteria bacterium]MDC1157735.1 thiamine pyrophosphate-binding protein [Alphaproteobacteria bacterium]